MEIFGKLGINWQVLTFQIINFCILLWLLNKLAYKPLLSILEDRRKGVEATLKKAEETTRASEEAKKKLEAELSAAKEKAGEIVTRAEKQATETIKNSTEKATAQAEEIVTAAKGAAAQEKASVIESLQKDIAELVVDASSAVLQKEVAQTHGDVIDTQIAKHKEGISSKG